MDLERRINDLVGWWVRRGLPLAGARWLEVRGRRSGEWRGAVVNPLGLDGTTYLVAPRGSTQWVRNVREAGECRVRGAEYAAAVVPVAERGPVIDAYLARWGWQVGRWMRPGCDPADHPVFRLEAAS